MDSGDVWRRLEELEPAVRWLVCELIEREVDLRGAAADDEPGSVSPSTTQIQDEY